ncbi:MAG: rhomboid family intramembrane serine protease [Myxococcota bacterium]
MNQPASFTFRKPSRSVAGLLIGLLVSWVAFALAINWAEVGEPLFGLLAGDSSQVLRGQIWRLVTASLVHAPGSVGHILVVLLMLYFFATPLEERWGTRRLFVFLALSSVFAFSVETLAWLAAPSAAANRWLGGMVMADACMVAWALSARGETIRLYFLIPLKPMVLVWLLAGYNVLRIIATDRPPEGLFAPFAAMGAGFLFGADQSPVRRAFLKWKLRRLQAEVDHLTRTSGGSSRRPAKARPSHLQVIRGGRRDDDDERGGPDRSLN